MRAAIVVGWLVALVTVAGAQPAPLVAAPPVREPCALVVVVDQSASMRGARLEAVKAAVVDILGTLDPRDEIAVVGSGAKASVVVPLQSVGNRKQIAAGVARLRAGGRGRVAAALDAVPAVMGSASADRKRVIVIASGGDRVAGVRRAAAELFDVGATVSAVALDPAAEKLVGDIVAEGHGRALALDDLAGLPTILVAETSIPTVLDPRAFVFVIDHSASMKGAKLEAAKETVRASVEVLGTSELVAVVTFDLQAQVLAPLQRAKNRARISSDLARLTAGAGADPYAGLHAADSVLAGAPGTIKTVILLTDGAGPYEDVTELAATMADRGITIHVVGVAGADRNLMGMIAEAGGGRLYLVDDIGRLPEVFRLLVPPSR